MARDRRTDPTASAPATNPRAGRRPGGGSRSARAYADVQRKTDPARDARLKAAWGAFGDAVQTKDADAPPTEAPGGVVHAAAAEGVAGSGGPLPFLAS